MPTGVTTYPTAPLNVVAADVPGTNTIVVSWSPPANDGSGGSTGAYITSYNVSGVNVSPPGILPIDGSGGGGSCVSTGTPAATTCTFSGALASNTYTFTVYATNSYGQGPVSVTSSSVTMQSVPFYPTNVGAVASSNGTVVVSWLPPTTAPTSIAPSGYQVSATEEGSGATLQFSCNESTPVSGTNSCTLTGLPSGQQFGVRVTAISAFGPYDLYPTGGIAAADYLTSLALVDVPQQVGLQSLGSSALNYANWSQLPAVLGGGYLWAIPNGTTSACASPVVSKIDPATGLTHQITSSLFDCPVAITSDANTVWVVNAQGGSNNTGSIVGINITTGTLTQITSPLINAVSGIASDGTSLWLFSQSPSPNGTILSVNISTGAVTQLPTPALSYPVSIASDGTYTWIAFDSPGVEVINDATGTTSTISTGSYAARSNSEAIAAANGLGWEITSSGAVLKLDPLAGTFTVVSSTTVPTGYQIGQVSIAAYGGAVWASVALSNSSGTFGSTQLTSINVTAGTQSTVTDPAAGDYAIAAGASSSGAWFTVTGLGGTGAGCNSFLFVPPPA